jgi:hypothetical protein
MRLASQLLVRKHGQVWGAAALVACGVGNGWSAGEARALCWPLCERMGALGAEGEGLQDQGLSLPSSLIGLQKYVK